MSVHIHRDVKCYRVINVYECGSFFVAHGDETDNQWVKVSIISDYGNFGYYWSHTGSPWDKFLANISFDYAMNKFMGKDLYRPLSITDSCDKLKQIIIDARRNQGELTKQQARDMWYHTDPYDYECSPEHFRYALSHNCEQICDLNLPDSVFNEVNPQAKGFWEKLWPEFIKAVETEMGGKTLEHASSAACSAT